MGALGECCLGGELGCHGMEEMLLVGGEEEDIRFGSELECGGGIEDAVKVLLQGLGEDPDRDGLKKTPLRVAKALREGTRGTFSSSLFDFLFFLLLVIFFLFFHSSYFFVQDIGIHVS